MIMSFNEFIEKHNLKNDATSNLKIYQVFSSIGLDKFGLYLRDGPFEIDIGIVNLHPSQWTHWVACLSEKYFDIFACGPPNKLSQFIIKRNGLCLFSDNKIQGVTIRKVLLALLIVHI